MYSLKDDISIIIKGADKGSVVIVWDREDYLKEAYRQLDNKEVYEQIPDNLSALANTLIKVLEKIHLRGDLSKDTLDYFLKTQNLQDFICYLKSTNDYVTCQEDQ